MLRLQLLRAGLLAAIFLNCVTVLFGQTAQLTGLVKDSSEAVVPAANVSIIKVDTGVKRSTTSNEEGYYTIPFVQPGEYRISVQVSGFKPITRGGITLSVDQIARIDFVLEVGPVAEAIEISGATPLVRTETGSLSQVIDNRKITQIPLNGRNVYSLVSLVPGAATDNSGRVRVNGVRARSNEFLVDGVTQVGPATRAGPAQPPPIDSIQEFNVQTSSYSAEYGNSAGALVNVATKSGGNEYHATLWEFLRNDALNTRNFFAPPNSKKPILRQNQFGAAGGGPIYVPRIYDGRGRTFFFVDYEGTRNRGQAVFNVNVPTAAMRAGDFAAFLGPVIGTDALGREVRRGQIYDPYSQRTLSNGQVVRDPIPGNVLTPDLMARLDPAAVKLLQFYPAPTEPALFAQNFRRATSTGSDNDRFDLRLDHVIGNDHRIFGRFSNQENSQLPNAPFRGVGFDSDATGSSKTFTSVLNSTFNASTTNEVRFSALQLLFDRIPFAGDRNVGQEAGIANLTHKAGVPFVDIANLTALGANGVLSHNDEKVYSLISHLSHIHGKHSLKLGGEWRYYKYSIFQPDNWNGRFNFRDAQTALPGSLQAQTGNPFASFLFGLVNQVQYTQKDPGQTGRTGTYAGFIQDDFKVTPKLTLNLGLRYELNTRAREINGIQSTFDLSTQRILAGKAKPDVPLDKNNFAPRFGFALDLLGDQTMVLRGGYGVFHQPITGGGGQPLWGVPAFPFATSSNTTSAGVEPAINLSQGPVLVPDLSLDDPRLGFGTNVAVQAPNLAAYAQQWNLGVERSVGKNTVIGLAYVGSASKKVDSGRAGYINVNQVPIEKVRQAAIDQGTSAPNTAPLLPFPNFNEVRLMLPRYGDSNYHSLQLKAERRLSAGLNFLASYTWSKNIDNAVEVFGFTGGTFPQDIYNLDAERAVSNADVPQVLVTSYVWDLPFGAGRQAPLRGFLKALIGGWQLSGITTLASGRPVDVEQTTITSRTFSNLQRPNTSCNPLLPRSQRTLDRFFNTSCFSAAAPLSFGTSPRNPIRGPGLINFDASLNKEWRFFETRALEFRAEFYNLTNTPPFQLDTRTFFNPSVPVSQQSFGRITSAGAGRVIQFALKLKL